MSTTQWIEKMRRAARLAAATLEMIETHIQPGVTTNTLNDRCHEFMVSHGAVPAPLGYKGYPKSICTSVNRVVCHGIPNDKPLKRGDILNIDVSLSLDGAYADTCRMYCLDDISVQAKRVVQCAKECTYAGIAQVAPGRSLKGVGQVIEAIATRYGYSSVRDFCGHGIGTALHTEPQVLHYAHPANDKVILRPGMTFTIEPMINVGRPDVKILSDGWTAVTKDRSLSAQYEHTVLVTEEGVEVLTLRAEENLADILATGL